MLTDALRLEQDDKQEQEEVRLDLSRLSPFERQAYNQKRAAPGKEGLADDLSRLTPFERQAYEQKQQAKGS